MTRGERTIFDAWASCSHTPQRGARPRALDYSDNSAYRLSRRIANTGPANDPPIQTRFLENRGGRDACHASQDACGTQRFPNTYAAAATGKAPALSFECGSAGAGLPESASADQFPLP